MTDPRVKNEHQDFLRRLRPRRWGWGTDAVDLGFLFLEYDHGKAVALVEYKHERAGSHYITDPTYQALIDLGERAELPVIGVRYAGDFSWWTVTAANSYARKWVPERLNRITEREWVTLLYKIRNQDAPEESFWESLGVEI